jgi:hypothetical protein
MRKVSEPIMIVSGSHPDRSRQAIGMVWQDGHNATEQDIAEAAPVG